MVNIVIPMAGEGKRFAEVGYKEPKPFIDVNGQTMIERVIQNVEPSEDRRVISIVRTAFLEEHEESLKKVGIDEVITVDSLTEGAACTVLLAEKLINTNDELVIANADQLILDENFMDNGLYHFRTRKADGGIWGFWADNPKWSFGRIALGRVVEVAEKQVISNFATCGVYYYRRGADFVSAAHGMIKNNVRVNNEFYVCPVFNQMIVRGQVIYPFFVNEMWGLGTPEDLRGYLEHFS